MQSKLQRHNYGELGWSTTWLTLTGHNLSSVCRIANFYILRKPLKNSIGWRVLLKNGPFLTISLTYSSHFFTKKNGSKKLNFDFSMPYERAHFELLENTKLNWGHVIKFRDKAYVHNTNLCNAGLLIMHHPMQRKLQCHIWQYILL